MNSKICRVTAVAADKYLFVEIETDDGRIGVGEAGAWSHIEATREVLNKFALYLVGCDSRKITHHFEVLTRFGSHSGSVIMAAVSAIDLALWDLMGQRLNAPIYTLLGGPCRDRVRVYPQSKGATREELVQNCKDLAAASYTAIGHINPFLDEQTDIPVSSSFARRMTDAVETLEAISDVIDTSVELCLDMHRRLRPAEAIAFGRRIAHLLPLFYEDPIRPGSIPAMAAVQKSLSIPVATGERFYSLEQFSALLDAGAARYIRPCLSLCGGLTGGMRIAALARAHQVDVIPHNTYSPIAVKAALHFAASVPNLLIMEYPTALYTDDSASTTLIANDMVIGAPEQENGFLNLDTLPGLGVSLRPNVTELFPVRPIPVELRAQDDNAPVEN